jgi:hypothetical protein
MIPSSRLSVDDERLQVLWSMANASVRPDQPLALFLDDLHGWRERARNSRFSDCG